MIASLNAISASQFLTLVILLSSSNCITCSITSIPQKAYNDDYLNPKFYLYSNQFCNKTLTETITFNFSSTDCDISQTQQFDCTGASSGSIQLSCENNVTGVDQVKKILIKGTARFSRGNATCSCQGQTSVEFFEFIPTPQPAPISWPIALAVAVVVGFAAVAMKKCSRRTGQDNNNELLPEE